MGRAVTAGYDRHLTLETIRNAATIVYDVACRTPMVPLRSDPVGDSSSPMRLFLKLETLQPIGSFKIRGAYNAIRQLSPRALSRGVWTVSAGNAAQGVALAARSAAIPCSVLMVDTAPQTKLDAVERLGAHIATASYEECWKTVERRDTERLAGHFVHPFDDDHFMSGNGTIGLEIVEDLDDVDAVVASVGGGGLLAGIATAIRALKPDTRIYAAEPETAAPLFRSFAQGRASVFEEWQPSFVDGCGGKSVIPTMWPLLRELVDESIVVGLDQISAAMRLVAERTHVIAEGAAACAVAAALTGRAGSGNVVAIVSGGNIDLTTFAQLTAATTPQ